MHKMSLDLWVSVQGQESEPSNENREKYSLVSHSVRFLDLTFSSSPEGYRCLRSSTQIYLGTEYLLRVQDWKYGIR